MGAKSYDRRMQRQHGWWQPARAGLCLGVLAGLWPAAASATVLEQWDTKRLVAESTIVVEARVLGAQATSMDGRNIETQTRLRVTRALVGAAPQEIVVAQHGGTHGGHVIFIPGSPSLPVNANVIVFLTWEAGRYWVTGMAQGVYVVTGATASRNVPVPVAHGGTIAPAGSANRAIAVTALRSEIRAAARGSR
jgi:hypothetical protein